MEQRGIERRELLKRAGVGSAAVGDLALTTPGVARASSDNDDAMFVHVDGS